MTSTPDSPPPSPSEVAAALCVPHDALQRLASRVEEIMARAGERVDPTRRPSKQWTDDGPTRRLGTLERQTTSRR
jgi:hypothetical protein